MECAAIALTGWDGSAKVQTIRMTVGDLLEVCSPSFQRSINHDHVEQIARDVLADWQQYGTLSIQQSISVAVLRCTTTKHLIDGQHRLQAFGQLIRGDLPQLARIELAVVVYFCENKDEVMFWYSRINHHLPIHPLELELAWNEKIKPLFDFFSKRWRMYLSKSERAMCPNMNLATLKTVLEKRSSLLDHELITPKTLVEDLVALNEEMKRRSVLYVSGNARLQKCVSKNPDDPCFFGYWKNYEWVDFVLHRRIADLRWETLDWAALDCSSNAAAPVRRSPPQSIRWIVWSKCNDRTSVIGKCYVCSEELTFQNMECGHDIPHHLSGKNDVDNLWPICRTCNRDMGVSRLQDFKKWYESFLLTSQVDADKQ